MKIAFFVLADLFVPLMTKVGAQLHSAHGVDVSYLSFLPRDHMWLKDLGVPVFPKRLCGLERAVTVDALSLTAEKCLSMTEFMRAKHGGTDLEWIARCRVIGGYLREFIAAEKPDAFVLWNGQDHVGKLITHFAAEQGIQVLYMENGYFSNTLQIDPKGVNSSASIAALSLDEILGLASRERVAPQPAVKVDEVGEIPRRLLLKSYFSRVLDRSYYSKYPEQRGSSWKEKKRLEQFRAAVPADVFLVPDRFVFVPLQVHDDTQVLLNCKHFNAVEPFFDATYRAIRSEFGADFPIVVKEHPEDIGRYSYDDFKSKYPDVFWLRKFDVELLLDKASCVVVINSSVGLQAIRRHKPTVVFGESFYSKPEIAFLVSDLSEVNQVFRAASRGVDSERVEQIDRFVDYLSQNYFLPGSWRRVSDECQAKLAAKILNLLS